VEKPALPDAEEVSGAPPTKASRPVWWQSDGAVAAAETDIYELSEVRAGNEIAGPAIVESVATTFAIPPGRRARLDRNQIFHLGTDSA
jgi:acetone carboxylase beta subunit